ncbi:hypothetical protein [Streptomyces sp. NK08204]|uniref:hypothetical protein n=1 Tax=Streptomyces sp. NK08204 TaxID=2873260 RepID=UPI001CED55DE|nr:hypothetical protein [Streptomyces sp. NK08204]
MPSYSDVQKAVNVEKRRLWFAWLAGGLILLFVARAVWVFSPTGGMIAAVVALLLFVLLSVTAYRMHQALNRRADRERREVLGDDYPG